MLRRSLPFATFVLVLLSIIASPPAPAQSTVEGSTALGGQASVRVPHTTHPWATAANAVGHVEDGRRLQRMLLVLAPTATQEEELKKLLEEQQNLHSANYHRWLTAKEFGARFGAADADVQKVLAWLEGAGFTVSSVGASKRWVEFSGTAGQVASAFHTEMQYYRVRGKSYLANATDVAVPAELAGITRGVASLNNFGKRPGIHETQGLAGTDAQRHKVRLTPSLTASGSTNMYYVAPGDFAAIYNTKALLGSGIDGSGVSIAVTAQSDIELTDAQQFRQLFQLKTNDPNIFVSGPDPGVASQLDADEALLDVEWAGAVAPGATIDLVVAGSTDTTSGVDLAAAYAIDNEIAPILTYTYGSCEQALGTTGNAFYNALWQQAAAEGITVLVAAGDNGAAGCDDPNSGMPAALGPAVNGAGSTPYDLAVGGTEFAEGANPAAYWNSTNAADYSSAIGYIPEAAWDESCDPGQAASATNCAFGCTNFNLLAGGGGASTVYTKPGWQSGTGVPADGMRDLPDVALAATSAHDDAVYCTSLGGSPCELNGQQELVNLTLVGGTSVSTPAMAGILALVEQKNGAFQGQVNYTLYRLAQVAGNSCDSTSETNPAAPNSCVFYDITAGGNSVPCAGGSPGCSSSASGMNGILPGYTAGPGYDLATGLGSVNAANLAAAWSSAAMTPSQIALQNTSISMSHGTPVMLNGTVSAAGGSGTPSGAVSFRTDAYGNSGQTATLTAGSFSGTVSDLPGGQYNLTAHYAGDAMFAASDSNAVPVTITPESSVTNLAANGLSGGSASYGVPVQLRTTVAGSSGNGVATGTVTLQDGANRLGTFNLAQNGSAYISVGGNMASLMPGTHALTAVYSGDNSFKASTSAPLTLSVSKGMPFVVVGVNTPTIATGQTVGAHAVVSGGGSAAATGTVQFTVDGAAYGAPVALNSGGFFGTQAQASLLISNLTQGTHVIGASYECGGDPNYASVASVDLTHELTQTVTVGANAGSSTTTSLTVMTTPVTLGATGTFKVSVAPKTATGTVTIWDAVGPRSVASPMSGGSASIQFAWTQAGTTSVYAMYSGDASNAASVSAPATFTVQPGMPQVALTAAASTTPTQQFTVNASVTGNPANAQLPVPTGAVELWDSVNGGTAQLLATQSLTPGAGGIGVTGLRLKLPAGMHSMYFHYRGDSNWQAANSPVAQTTSASFSLSVNSITFAAGSPASTTVTITPIGGFSGSVALTCATGGSNPPAGYNCGFTNSTVTVSSSGPASTQLNLTLGSSMSSAVKAARAEGSPGALPAAGVGLAVAMVMIGLLGVGGGGGKGGRNFLLACGLVVGTLTAVSACGGGGGGSGGGPVSTSTTITSSNLHVGFGTAVTFTITVTPNGSATPNGMVQLTNNGQALGSPTKVTGGVASVLAASLPVGVNTITAQYLGDATTQGSTSAPIKQLIAGNVNIQVSGASGGTTETTNFTAILN